MADQPLDQILDQLIDEYGDWDSVAEMLRMELEEADDDAARIGFLEQLAVVHAEHRADHEAAVEALERILELDPENSDVFEPLVAAYEHLEDWESVTAVLVEHVGAVEEPADKAELLRRAAAVFEGKLDQGESACLLLKTALGEAPLDQLTWAAVEETWTRLQKHAELAELLNEHASLVSETAGEAVALPLIVATARAHQADGNATLAEAFLTRASLLDEDDEEILRAQVSAQEEAGHWDALAESLTRLADKTLDAEEEAALRRKLGRVAFEQLDDLEGATAAFARAFALAGDADDAETLAALYQAAGNHAELASLLRVQAESAEPDDRPALLERVAAIEASELGDPEAARRTYEDVLVIAPDHEAALEAIAGLLERAEDWAGLADHLARWSDYGDDDAAIGRLRRRAAILEERLQDAEGAIATLGEARSRSGFDGSEHRVEVLTSLCRLHESAGRQADAAALRFALAEATDTPEEWRAHVLAAAEQLRALGMLDDATAAYQSLVDHDAGDVEALRALEDLQTEAGDLDGAIASLRQRIELAADDAERVALLLRLGNLEAADAPDKAAASFRAVLAVDPAHATASNALADCLERTESWRELATVLALRAENERALGARARILARLGAVRSEHLDDPAGARTALEEAVELDPTCVAAARPLADAYMAEEAWERALPLLESLRANAADSPTAEQYVVALDVAVVSELLGLDDKAVGAYEAALDLEPGSVQSMLALGRLYTRAARHADADRVYRALVAERFDQVAENDRVELYCRAGDAAAAIGDSERAGRLFRSALAIDELYEHALRSLAALDAGGGDARERLEAKQALLQLTDEAGERFRLLLEIADGFSEIEFDEGAAEALTAALEIQPESKAALHKLLALHTSAERWRDAVDTLQRLSKLEDDAARRTKLQFTIGAIYRDQIADVAAATDVFSDLLDAQPRNAEAFDAIVSIHRSVGGWKRLEREYRKQLKRIAELDGTNEQRVAIVCALAELYRDHLDRVDDALEAYRVASELDPDNLAVLEAIAAIYPKDGKTDAELVEQHRAILRLAPEREDSHHVLFGALQRERRFDEAWTTAATLTVLGSREKGPTEFYATHRPPSVPLARRGLSRAEWRLLQHPDLSVPATRLLAVIAGVLRRVYAVDVKEWGVSRKQDAIDVSKPGGVVNLFHYSAQVLGVAVPALYRWKGSGFQNANSEPRSVLVGADVVSAQSDRRMVYRIARTMCLMRNEFYLAGALTTETLLPLVQATIALFTGGPPREWDSEPVRAWMEAIRQEPDEILTMLGEAVGEYVQSGQSLNLREWPRAVELTAGRAALLLCGDVQRAAQACNEVPRPLGGLDVHDRVLDLVRFASTEDYATLRAELGLGIGQS